MVSNVPCLHNMPFLILYHIMLYSTIPYHTTTKLSTYHSKPFFTISHHNTTLVLHHSVPSHTKAIQCPIPYHILQYNSAVGCLPRVTPSPFWTGKLYPQQLTISPTIQGKTFAVTWPQVNLNHRWFNSDQSLQHSSWSHWQLVAISTWG